MTTPHVANRPWDTFDAYLFDIDGTLLHCSDAVHYFAFCDTLHAISGLPLNLEGVNANGNTDIGIVRDALNLAGVPDTAWRPKLPEIRSSLCRFVAERESELCADALPCVRDVLEHLLRRGATLGIATGNLREIGQMKLKRAGLLDFFQIGGWSDTFEYRADVFRHALHLMRSATHPAASICVLGDTPSDVHAARAVGLPVIAVATGIYPKEQLLETQPDLCLSSFADLFNPPVSK